MYNGGGPRSSLHLLLARPDIWDLWEQPERIRYVDADGNAKSTVFDFLATLRCGRKIAVAVKPAAIVEETGFRQELEFIRASTPLNFADDVVLVTDRSFTLADARNAERLQEFRRAPDEEADQIVGELLEGLQSETTIAELVASSGLDGRGFRAAFRAIYSGGAHLVTVGDISPKSQVMTGGERIQAASAAAKALPKDFVLVARADGFMYGLYDLDESIRRIQAFETAGADCVYVPYLNDLETVKKVCKSVSIPVNVGVSSVEHISMKDFANAGAARISLGMAMATATHTTLHNLSTNMFERGDFSALGNNLSYETIDECMAKGGKT